MPRDHVYTLTNPGYHIAGGKDAKTIRTVVSTDYKKKTVTYRAYGAPEQDPSYNVTVTRQSWLRWASHRFLPPRPIPLPIPNVSDVEMAFPTGRHTPPWYWVPDEFRNRPGGDYENHDHPWVRMVSDLFMGRALTEARGNCSWSTWRALPNPETCPDPEAAVGAVHETMGSWGIDHHQKLATCAFMLAEWFTDAWFEGDTVTRIRDEPVPTPDAPATTQVAEVSDPRPEVRTPDPN